MSELELYKFAQKCEMRWDGEALSIWIEFDNLEEFTDMIGYDYLSDGGLNVNLQQNCIAFDLVEICENYGIEPTNIFVKEV